MLHLVLAALVVGAPTDGDRDGDKKAAAPAAAETAQTASPIFRTGVAPTASALEAGQAESLRIRTMLGSDETVTNDTYAFGRPQEGTFLKLWTSYAWGQIEEMYGADGEENVDYVVTGRDATGITYVVPATVTTQRFLAGAQINPLDFRQFKLGVGAQGIFAQNAISINDGPNLSLAQDFDSGFALQSVKVFGVMEGKTLGIHGGYVFDLGEESLRDAAGNFTSAANSAEQDAWFAGASFDLPADWVRIFGGIDYYGMQEANSNNDGVQTIINGLASGLDQATGNTPRQFNDSAVREGNDLIFFNFGLGFQLSFFEIGASAILRTQLERSAAADEIYASSIFPSSTGAAAPTPAQNAATIFGSQLNPALPAGTSQTTPLPSGSHHGSLVPYLIVRPPNLPVALSVRGAVTNQFGDYGFSLGGANDFVTREGFTVALSYGF